FYVTINKNNLISIGDVELNKEKVIQYIKSYKKLLIENKKEKVHIVHFSPVEDTKNTLFSLYVVQNSNNVYNIVFEKDNMDNFKVYDKKGEELEEYKLNEEFFKWMKEVLDES